MNFFNITSLYKEMKLLEHIEQNTNTTQSQMAEVIDAAPSMVNSYIHKLEEEGYMKRVYQTAKVVDYRITSKGITRKNYLQMNYIRELMNMYIRGQESVAHFLERIEQKGLKKVLLYGAGEVAGIILDICQQQEFELEAVGLIDDNADKQNQKLRNIKIYTHDEIKNTEHDGIVITSYKYEEDIIKKLEELSYPMERVVRYFEA